MIVNYKNKYKKYKTKYLNLKSGGGILSLSEEIKSGINKYLDIKKSICLSYLIHTSIDNLNAISRISPNPSFTRLIINCPINVDTLNADKLTILQSITTVLYEINDLPPMEFLNDLSSMEFLKKLPNLKYLIFSNNERTFLEDLKNLKNLQNLNDFIGLNGLNKLQEIIFKNSNNSTKF